MPTIEERVARLEVLVDGFTDKADLLFSKLDKVADKLETVGNSLKMIEMEHGNCIKMRGETTGWLQGRVTKVFDAALAGGLVLLLLALLKNAGNILTLMSK